MKITIISDCTNTPYLIRLTIFELLGWSLKLHIFLRGDHDKELHDHPWSFWTWIIAGRYREEISHDQAFKRTGANYRLARHTIVVEEEGGVRFYIDRKKWSLAFRPAWWKHRVILPHGMPVATLVLTAPACRSWGFWRDGVFIPWRKFVSSRSGADC